MFDLCSVSLCRVLRLEAGFTVKAVFILKTCSVKKKKKLLLLDVLLIAVERSWISASLNVLKDPRGG